MAALVFIVAFCIVAVLVYMARYSGRLRVEQTRIIDAPVDAVYACAADFRRWGEWNPWAEHAAELQTELSGPADGKGGCYAWDDARIGSGTIEHLRLEAGVGIEQRMRFRQPFRFRGRGRWQFAARDGKTEVTWRMDGRVAFTMRAFAQTVQGAIALDFRYGLDRLASLIEPREAPRYSLAYPGLRDVAVIRYASRTYDGRLDGLGAALSAGFAELRRELAERNIAPAGAPLAAYVKTNIRLRTTVCHYGIPIGEADPAGLAVREMPAHRAYVVRLQGSYAAMEVAWYQAMQRLRIDGLQPDQRIPPFERYLDDPDTVLENERVTELHLPVLRTG